MRIVVIGCGAVGGYFGGRLLQSGEDVTFIARNQQLALLQARGLTLESIAGDVHLKGLKVVEFPPAGFKADIIFVAVKTFQLAGTLLAIQSMLDSNTRVIPLLNGISAVKELINGGIPEQNIVGGLVKIIARVGPEGNICHTGATPHITLGQGNPGFEQTSASVKSTSGNSAQVNEGDKLLEQLALKLKTAGISVGISRHIDLMLWRKYLFVAAWGTLASVARVPVGELRNNSESRALLQELMAEYMAIANSQDVAITPAIIDETMAFVDQLPQDSETSMQRDIVNQLPSEFDALVTDALLLARENNLEVPCLSFCHTVLALQLTSSHVA